jgi:hypothetical protein
MNRPAAVTKPTRTSNAISSGPRGTDDPPVGSVRTLTENPDADALSAADVSLATAASVDGALVSEGNAVLVTVEVRVRVAAARDALAAAADREAAATEDDDAAARDAGGVTLAVGVDDLDPAGEVGVGDSTVTVPITLLCPVSSTTVIDDSPSKAPNVMVLLP